MKIFISWSKKISMQYAMRTKELLESLDKEIEAFVSEEDINAGEEVQNKIIDKIMDCDKVILCFTKENKKSPWLLFEAGYAKGLQKTVIPILFDDDHQWHSWIDNPMNVAREIMFNADSFTSTLLNSLGLKPTSEIINNIKTFKTDIGLIKEANRVVDACCEDFVEMLMNSQAFTLSNPTFRNRTAYFLTGFESFELYKAITESFMYTGKYLWIYGRKNMKLFSGSYKEFFRYLDEKSYNDDLMSGIDFRCLFLNPNSDEVCRAHSQQNIFKHELISTIYRAHDTIGDNNRLKKCFRMYSNKREAIIIRLDNCILYSRPNFDANGIPQLLTNTPFEVFSVNSKKGRECIQIYENAWNNAEEIKFSF